MKEIKELKVTYYGSSDVGLVRTENQDSFGKFPKENTNLYQSKGLLFIVADGMGGHSGGSEASRLAVEIVSNEYYSSGSEVITNALHNAFKKANLEIHQTSLDAPQFHKKGTTCSALVLENNMAHIAHVGDSRIYKIAERKITQLTTDHTEVGEMLRKGILSEEEALNHPSKSVLFRAMGIESDIEVDLIDYIPIKNGDCFVLCSDGLAKVGTEEIKDIVLNNSPEDASKRLIYFANEGGGKDNVTVQVIKVTEDAALILQTSKGQKSIGKLFWMIAVIFLLGSLIIAGIIYKNEIWNLFSPKSSNENNNAAVKDELNETDFTENIYSEANNYLSAGNLDSALSLYNAVLVKNSLHIGALNGKELIGLKYIQIADKSLSDNNIEEALVYFNKALALNPDSKELKNKIISLQNRTLNSPRAGKKEVKNVNDIIDEQIPTQISESDMNPSTTNKPPVASVNASEWNAAGLTENDYKFNENEIIFFNTNKSKKLLYKNQIEDIDIEVNLQLDKNVGNNKAGIIIGYGKSKDSDKEEYYLFTTDNSGNFTLQRHHNDKNELLVTSKRSLTSDKPNYSLKIKCLGPWIMLYNDNKLLESYLAVDFIRGQIGLYSEDNTYADFKDLKITSAFEK